MDLRESLAAEERDVAGPGLVPVAVPEPGAVAIAGQDPVVGGVAPGVALGGVVAGGPVPLGIEAEGLEQLAELVPLGVELLLQFGGDVFKFVRLVVGLLGPEK
jgi:hypothetical protein